MEKTTEHGPLYFELNTGAKMPAVGLGTWKASPAVISAIKAGYRHIDCARVYNNKKEVGFDLKESFTIGVSKRSEIWITFKLWCSDADPADVSKALSKTLEDLQLDYVDIYLNKIWFPWVGSANGPIMSARNMESPYASGQARAIGVSNFLTKKLQDLFTYAKIPPAVHQVECHPVWQQSQLHNLCTATGILLSAYSPLGSSGSRMKGEILKELILFEIAEKLQKMPAQVALRWGILSGHSVLPRSTNESTSEADVHNILGN